jgi:hypothetical protein
MRTPASWAGRDEVLRAVEEIRGELASGASSKWENQTLDDFLESFSGMLEDMEHVYENERVPPEPDPWVVLARALRGARYYE